MVQHITALAGEEGLQGGRDAMPLFEAVFRHNPSLMTLSSLPDMRFIDVNAAFLQATGYRREEVIGRVPADLGLMWAQQRDHAEGAAAGEGNRREQQIRRHDGSLGHVLMSGEIISHQGREYYLGVMQDISDRKAMEEELGERETRLRLALETAQLGYWRWTAGENRVEWFNDHGGLFGLGDGEFTGSLDHVQDIVHPDDRQMGLDNLRRTLEEGIPFDNTYRVVHKDGSIRWLNSYGHLTYGETGSPESIFGITRDISGHRFALEEVKERLAQLTALLESVPGGVLVEDSARRVVFANQLFCDFFALPAPEFLVGADCAAAARDASVFCIDPEGFLQKIAACIIPAAGTSVLRLELRDGRILECTSVPVEMAGRSCGRLWMYVDKTAQLRAEAELIRAKEAWERTFDAVPDLISVLDPEHRILHANRALAAKFGAEPASLQGQYCYKIIHSLDLPPEYCPHSKTLRDLREHAVQVGKINVGGDYLVTTTPLMDGQGRLLGSVHVARDISRLKDLQRQLRDSADYTRRILDSLDAHMAVVGPDGVIIDVNAAWRGFALENGAGEEDRWGVGASYECCSSGSGEENETAARAFAGIGAVRRGELPLFEMEYCCRTPLNKRWFMMRVLPLLNAPGTVLVSHVDITRRRVAELALERSNARNQAIISAMPDTLLTLDEHGLITGCSVTGQSEPPFAPEAVIGRRVEDALPPATAGLTRSHARDVLAGGGICVYRFVLPRQGREQHFEARMVQAGSGEVLVIVRNITSMVLAEQERLEMERRLLHSQKLESLGVLAGGIAHDFNNLLLAILGHADLALNELAAHSPVRDSLAQIVTASHRAADLCRQMLAYAGKGRFIVESFDLAALVAEMAHLLRTSMAKGVTCTIVREDGVPLVQGDATQLRQVVMNLVINAAEASGEQGGSIRIAIGAAQCRTEDFRGLFCEGEVTEGRHVVLEVADRGCGMDEQTLKRMFEPFFTTKFTGRGLGMAAVLGIVRGHGGFLTVQSWPGQGTTFRVYLPPAAPGNDEGEHMA